MQRFLESVLAADTAEEVWSMHLSEMASYGFDRLLYGFTRFRTEKGFGDVNDLLIFSNHDNDYIQGYVHENLYFDAPMVRWAARHDGAKSWSWVSQAAETFSDRERAVVEFNRSHGVHAGYSISFRDASIRNKGAIALTAQPGMDQAAVDALWKMKGRDILTMNEVVHLKLITLPHPVAGRGLTPRQRETLEWVRDGKTMQDIAAIMGLTQATVEKHLRLARAALDVDTTAQAVLKASFQNQIFVLQQ